MPAVAIDVPAGPVTGALAARQAKVQAALDARRQKYLADKELHQAEALATKQKEAALRAQFSKQRAREQGQPGSGTQPAGRELEGCTSTYGTENAASCSRNEEGLSQQPAACGYAGQWTAADQAHRLAVLKRLVRNAICHVCLAGAARQKEAAAVLACLDGCDDSDNFVILFKSSQLPLHYKGLYKRMDDSGEVTKLHGSGPDVIQSLQVATFFNTWDFSVWDFQKPKLVRLAMSIFHAEGLLQTFGIPAQQFVCFMEAVLDSSGGHPYHNMYHSMAVLHGCWYMVELHKDRRLFTPLEKLALFTAGLGMNLDHPGLTNSYMCASGHDLALRYNDMSVAEQHCTSCLFVLLRDPACNILCNVSPSEFRGIRTIIIGAIIHTDPQASATFNPFAHSSRHASQLGLVLDAAVCATAIKPWAIYKHFSNDLQAELDAEVGQHGTRARQQVVCDSQTG
ncbi:hypothetical protein WJX72_009696 [[Myrmecia] bisecta]|uniref:PDEase domain-containing protein n=1 Tax=[Myrmecia] bisecta TaxID=41462 RepID=A0AAW1R7W1_9CHLO